MAIYFYSLLATESAHIALHMNPEVTDDFQNPKKQKMHCQIKVKL